MTTKMTAATTATGAHQNARTARMAPAGPGACGLPAAGTSPTRHTVVNSAASNAFGTTPSTANTYSAEPYMLLTKEPMRIGVAHKTKIRASHTTSPPLPDGLDGLC